MAQLDFSTRQLANPSAGIQQNLHDLGAMFGQFQQNKLDADKVAKEEARYQTEQARLKVLDDRIAQEWKQKQDARQGTMELQKVNNINVAGQQELLNNDPLQQAFNRNIGAVETQQNAAVMKAIATDPRAKSLYDQYSAEDQGFQGSINRDGVMVAATPEDKARLNTLNLQRVAEDIGLGSTIGVDKYKKGEQAYRLAAGEYGEPSAQGGLVNPQQMTTDYSAELTPAGSSEYREGPAKAVYSDPTRVVTQQAVPGHTTSDYLNSKQGTVLREQLFRGDKRTPLTADDIHAKYDDKISALGIGVAMTHKPSPQRDALIAARNTELKALEEKNKPISAQIDTLKKEFREVGRGRTPETLQKQKDIGVKISALEMQKAGEGYTGGKMTPAQFSALSPENKGDLLKSLHYDYNKKKGRSDSEIQKSYGAINEWMTGKAEKSTTKKGELLGYERGPMLGGSGSLTMSSSTKIVTPTGKTVDISKVPKGSEGYIVQSYKDMEQAVSKIGTPQVLVDRMKKMASEVANKHGVTMEEMGVDKMLKSSGMDGSLTPTQERKIATLEGAQKAATEQYKMDVQQANTIADRNLRLMALQQAESHHRDSMKVQYAKIKQDEKVGKRDPVQDAIDKEMALRRLDIKFPKALTPKDALSYNTAKRVEEKAVYNDVAGNDWNPFTWTKD